MSKIINEWPDSQKCIGCRLATFVLEGSSRYTCDKNFIASSLECEANRVEASQEEWSSKFR